MKRAGTLMLCILLFFTLPEVIKAETADILQIANGIVNWKKADNRSTSDGFLINETFLELAGSTPGDWFPIGLSRLGIADNYDGYLAVIKDQIQERYRQPGKLSAAKATEWHRISLAVLAMGGDPTNIGVDENGQPINLIADGTYNRGWTTPLGRQGINGWIWGLITLDSMRYAIPDDAYYTRDAIIIEILRQQLSDGGFALSGNTADPDITAMALQALAPYYNSEKAYTYKQKALNADVTKTVRQVTEDALVCLSEMQLETGDFKSWGTQNVESTDQVVVALCCLGIDPLQDERFIKNGNTLLDGILQYRMPDGGFVHSYTYDPDNPSSLPDQSNTMASEQTLYTMAAIRRQQHGLRTLYDFRAEQSPVFKQRITDLQAKIDAVGIDSGSEYLKSLLAEFYSIPETERCYVYNYRRLSDAAKAAGVDVEKIANETPAAESPSDDSGALVPLYFTDSEKNAVDNLPEKLTTEQYVLVTTLLDRLLKAEDFAEKEEYLQKLIHAKESIAAVQDKIDCLNADIREKLYPFENMSLRDKGTVDDIVARYKELSEYDRAKIERWEDVIKTKTQLDNLLRGIVIAAALCITAAITAVFLIRRIKKRRKLKQLSALYENEDE